MLCAAGEAEKTVSGLETARVPNVQPGGQQRANWEIQAMRYGRFVKGALIVSLSALSALGGCIEGRSDITYGPKGPPAGRSTLRQVKLGETSKEWLLGTLGTPTRQTRTPDGTEIMTYEYTKQVDSDFEALLLLNFKDKRQERTVYTFELTDGIVTDYWKD
jgi:hypothetical protein